MRNLMRYVILIIILDIMIVINSIAINENPIFYNSSFPFIKTNIDNDVNSIISIDFIYSKSDVILVVSNIIQQCLGYYPDNVINMHKYVILMKNNNCNTANYVNEFNFALYSDIKLKLLTDKNKREHIIVYDIGNNKIDEFGYGDDQIARGTIHELEDSMFSILSCISTITRDERNEFIYTNFNKPIEEILLNRYCKINKNNYIMNVINGKRLITDIWGNPLILKTNISFDKISIMSLGKNGIDDKCTKDDYCPYIAVCKKSKCTILLNESQHMLCNDNKAFCTNM